MTPEEFYRRSTIVPLLGMVPSFALGLFSIKGIHNPVLRFLAGLPATLFFVGAFAAIPYGVYLLVVWRFFRPESEWEHRRIALIAPLAIAAVFVVLVSILESIGHSYPPSEYLIAIAVPG